MIQASKAGAAGRNSAHSRQNGDTAMRVAQPSAAAQATSALQDLRLAILAGAVSARDHATMHKVSLQAACLAGSTEIPNGPVAEP